MADWKLLIEDDAGQTITVPLFRDVITIGRKEGNTIRLTERNVSRFHAKIVRDNGTVFVEDLGSFNGIKLNGDKIKGKVQVREGDLIEIGDYHLELQREGAGAQASPLSEPTQRLTPAPMAARETQPATPSAADDDEEIEDEFAGDTQRWEPPASMEPVGVGMPTVQDQAPIGGSDHDGPTDMPTVDETLPLSGMTARQLGTDSDETLRHTPNSAFPSPTFTDPFASPDGSDGDETMPVPGGPEDAGLLAAMTEQIPAPISTPSGAFLTAEQGAAISSSGSGPFAAAPMPSPSAPSSPAAMPRPTEPPPPRPPAPAMRSLTVEKEIPAVAHGATEDTQAIVRAPASEEDAHVDKPRLVAINTVFAGSVFPITRDEMVIGRVEDNDLVIEHRSVSRSHAKVVREGNRYRIVDLKSANGILVNGNEVDSHILRPGDVLELGRVRLRFVPPGERFKLSAAEIERARVADVQGDGFEDDAGGTALVSGAFAAQAIAGTGAARPGLNRTTLLIGGLGVLVLVLAVALVVLLSSDRDGATTTVDPPPSTGTLADAAALEEKGDLKGAAALLDRLAKAGEPGASDALARVERGMANEVKIGELQGHIEGGRYKDAVVVGRDVIEDAPRSEEAFALVDKARTLGADASYKTAKGMVDSEDFLPARAALDDLLFFEPNSERAAELEGRIEKATGTPPPPRKDPDPRDEVRRPKPEKRDPKPPPPKDKDDRRVSSGRDPEGARAAYDRATKLLFAGKYGKAIDEFVDARKLDPSIAETYRGLGTAYLKLGDQPKALSNFKTYLTMAPAASDRAQISKQIAELEEALRK